MDQQSTIEAFNNLIQQYPDLNMTIVSDVLQACDQDIDRAYATLCEMVIPAEQSHIPTTQAQKTSPPLSEAVQYAFPNEPCFDAPTQQLVSPRSFTPPSLQGAWASKNMGRRFRVDEMCNKYTWVRRKVVEDLFDKNGDCVELVESEILQIFPIDEPAAFGDTPKSQKGRNRGVGTRRQRAMAESLRAQAADELRSESSSSKHVSMASQEMQAMRQQLWEARETRMRLNVLASQTGKAAHITNAKEKDEELKRLSANFLSMIRLSEEYRNGVVDLHGLTKDEAIQIVEWKLQDGGRKRFRLITGRGNHSHNYQAVLKPALEKHFRSKRVSFTRIEDGVLSVVLP